jgi:hypothetical protein
MLAPPALANPGPVAPPALDQCVVEHRLVAVFAGDHDALVPGPGVDDPLVTDVGAEALGVDGGQGVAGAVHAASAVAAPDDRDQLACLLVVVGGGELAERLLRGAAAEERDDVVAVAPACVSRTVSPSPIYTAPSVRVVPMNTR